MSTVVRDLSVGSSEVKHAGVVMRLRVWWWEHRSGHGRRCDCPRCD